MLRDWWQNGQDHHQHLQLVTNIFCLQILSPTCSHFPHYYRHSTVNIIKPKPSPFYDRLIFAEMLFHVFLFLKVIICKSIICLIVWRVECLLMVKMSLAFSEALNSHLDFKENINFDQSPNSRINNKNIHIHPIH